MKHTDVDSLTSPKDSSNAGKRRGVGLSAKLLALTVLFVMLAEVLIYVPSIANFRQNWLKDRLNAAQIAALVLDAAPGDMVPQDLQRELLDNVGAHAVAMKRADTRRMLAFSDMPPNVDYAEDLRQITPMQNIMRAFDTLLNGADRVLRVVGDAPMGSEFVEIIIDEAPLRDAMLRFSTNILTLSVVISLITAGLVYLTLNWLLVRPMRRLTANMVAFANHPEIADRVIKPGDRTDEVGIAERELAGMQRQLAGALQQKSHLAAMGLAVSKINHDLRNLLASAQLLVDRVGAIPDPTVQRIFPKLLDTLDRAIGFCSDTLKYGSVQEPAPQRETLPLARLIDDVIDNLDAGRDSGVRFANDVDSAITLFADSKQFFRIFSNLGRNSLQAMTAPDFESEERVLRFAASQSDEGLEIRISDTGPGLPPKARERLFEAFHGSVRPGGTGLGLAIAAELIRSHGGKIVLDEAASGASFVIYMPPAAPLTVGRSDKSAAEGAAREKNVGSA